MQEDELTTAQIKYPIVEFVKTHNMWKIVNPIDKLKILSNKNWSPAPGYYPKTFIYMHENPNQIDDESFFEVVAKSFDRDYWNTRLEFWQETNFFPKRLQYIRKAIDAHFQKDFICSIYILVPQFEGIIKDYLKEFGIVRVGDFIGCVRKLKDLVKSRKVLLFPREIFKTIFQYLENGSFWRHTTTIQDPTAQVNRHGILHGVFTKFECESISLKYLILLDLLSFVLLHDRMLTYSL